MLSPQNHILISAPYGCTSETTITPRYYWDNTQRGKHQFVILQWTLDGEGVFEWEGVEHPVPAGKALIVIIPENTKYYYPKQGREPWHYRWVNFYGALAVSLFRELREAFGPVLPLPDQSAAGQLVQKLTETAHARLPSDPYETSAAVYEFIMEWTRQLSRPVMEAADPVQVAMALCAARFREPLGVKELAAQTGLSREHFTRIFTARTGKSPARHLCDLRVAAAQQMMRRPSVQLKEVALRCGFPSVRSLRRALE
jgi:AraC-like DNA-binding protein